MIYRYIFGRPFETGAVVNFPADGKSFTDTAHGLPCGKIAADENGFVFSFSMEREDMVFGLGESVRGINKRGFIYESWCSDESSHLEDKRSLYGAHNFIIIHRPGKEGKPGFSTGLFFDYPGKISFDLGYTKEDKIFIMAEYPHIRVYAVTPEEVDANPLKSICRQFRSLIGKSYVPPFWAMGFQQSRWGYGSECDLENVYQKYMDDGIPLDALYLDIDYMNGYRDFTVDTAKMPDLKATAERFKNRGVHIVPIIDAGIKADEDFDVDREGMESGYYCRMADGRVFTAGVWPGDSHFTDFFQNDAADWFGSKYDFLINQGIDGFWNDMNEPALFYSVDNAEKTAAKLAQVSKDPRELAARSWELLADVEKLQNNPEDYKSFYHVVPADMAGGFAEEEAAGSSTVMVRHDKVHNLYGYYMTKAAAESFRKRHPDKDLLLFSRASYIGMHRYAGIWTGDNCSWWSHLLLCIKQMPSLNMCGFLYIGSDIGGFGSDVSRDLLLRWLQFAVFVPLMRNHSALGTREQECWRFEKPEEFRGTVSLRYRLVPYLYETLKKAAENNDMYFRPLAFDYPDDSRALRIEDQLMVGDMIMATPVYEQNATGRMVYLPEDMVQVTCRPGKDGGMEGGTPEQKLLQKGDHYIDVPLDTVVFFIKKGCRLPVCKPAVNTAALDLQSIEYWGIC